MDTRMHTNLELLDQKIDELDVSPMEFTVLVNHMIGGLSALVGDEDWAVILQRACDEVRRQRADGP
jgi:hypothetical protein